MTRLLAVALLLSPAPAWAAPVVIGSKNYTEQVILGEALCRLLEASGIPARHQKELDGSQVIFKALQKGGGQGGVDAYVEYTGTLKELLKDSAPRGEEEMRVELARRGITLGGRLGFANNYALGIPGKLADREGIKNISDLVKWPKLRLGFSEEFLMRGDGWPAIKKAYGLPHDPQGMNHQLAVKGLGSGSLDVTDLYTTDPEIKSYGLRVLEDDRGVFKVYEAGLLWRSDLEQRHPGAVAALRRLEGKITTEQMVEMNNRVREDNDTEFKAAADFLHNHKDLGLEAPPPDPSFAGRLMWSMVGTTWKHLLLVLVSLAFAIVIAVPLGVLAYRVPRLGKYVLGLVSVIQTIPSMALLVFMIPLLGLGTWPALVALFLYSLLPIVRNTVTGLDEISPALKEAAEVIGLPPWARLWRIELPLASRSILSGIKTAAVINVGTATIGAIIGAGGYGQPILTGIRLDNIWIILSGAVPAALMAVAVQGLFSVLERFIVPRGLQAS